MKHYNFPVSRCPTKNANPMVGVSKVILHPFGNLNTSPGLPTTLLPHSSLIWNSPSNIIFISSYQYEYTNGVPFSRRKNPEEIVFSVSSLHHQKRGPNHNGVHTRSWAKTSRRSCMHFQCNVYIQCIIYTVYLPKCHITQKCILIGHQRNGTRKFGLRIGKVRQRNWCGFCSVGHDVCSCCSFDISIITIEIFVIAANEQHNSNDQVVASRSWHLSRASVWSTGSKVSHDVILCQFGTQTHFVFCASFPHPEARWVPVEGGSHDDNMQSHPSSHSSLHKLPSSAPTDPP